MKKPKNKLIIFVTLLACTLVIGVVPSVLAQDGDNVTNSHSEGESDSTSTNRDDKKTYLRRDSDKNSETRTHDLKRQFKETRQEVKRQRLDEKKKQLCDKRSDHINTLMTRVKKRSGQRFDRITRIYEAVKAFYAKKDLKVENYNELVAAVDAAKATAEKQLQDVKNRPTFSCDSDGPKADIQAFKEAREEKHDAFKAYRSAVLSLIKTIHTSVEDKS